jgi:ribosomal-protein-serine acetyltransferase
LKLPCGASLRPVREDDAEELYALIVRNRGELAPWLDWAAEQSLPGTRSYLERASRETLDGAALECALVVDGRIAGVAGLNTIDRGNHCAGIGYWLDRDSQGRGLITEAVAALATLAFAHLGLHRLEIRADIVNERSRAVAERLGFTYEGTMRGAYRVGERYVDDALYSLLASDPRRYAGVSDDDR